MNVIRFGATFEKGQHVEVVKSDVASVPVGRRGKVVDFHPDMDSVMEAIFTNKKPKCCYHVLFEGEGQMYRCCTEEALKIVADLPENATLEPPETILPFLKRLGKGPTNEDR